jgi:hypothetical protein
MDSLQSTRQLASALLLDHHSRDLHPERTSAMSQREATMLWIKDILDHLQHCHQQLDWTSDGATIDVLTQSMLRDLERCRRLIEDWQRRTRLHRAI